MKLTLKQLRNLHDLTQKEMADKLGVSLGTWINWEKQETFPNVPFIEKISEEFGVSYDDIIFFEVKHGLTVKNRQEV